MEDKNYRKVKEDKYFCGYNSKGKHESLLVVYESNDQKLAREYEKISQQWRCIGCKAFKEKVTIKIQNGGEIYAPLQHSCTPRNLDTIIVEQKRYRNIALFGDGKTFSTHSTVYENSQRFEKFGEDEYEFGVNGVRRPDSCIIVQHKTDKNLVYHYYTENKKWYCCKCYATSKDRKYGIFINNFLYLPKYHICTPIPREESMQEQAALLSDDSKADVLFIKYEKYLQIINECDYTYGVTPRFKKLNQQKLLIVCDSKYRNEVREYFYKIPSVWQCISCCLKKKYDTFAILKNGKMYVSKNHKCDTKSFFDIMEKQVKLLNHGKTRHEIKSLLVMIDKKMPLSLKMENYCLSSPSCIITSNAPSSSSSTAVFQKEKKSYNQRSRTIDMIHQQVWEPNITNVSHIVSNPGVQRRFPRSRTSTAPIPSVSTKLSVSAARKRGRPRKNPLPRSNSTSSLSDSSHSSLMELRSNDAFDGTENEEEKMSVLSLNHSSENSFQNCLPSSFFSGPFCDEQPSSKKIKIESKESPVIHFDFPDLCSSIPQLIPNEPMSNNDQESDEENVYVNQQSLELWPTSDNENGTSKNDNSQDIIKEKEPLALLENYVELYEEDYRNATQTTFNTTVDFNASDSEIHQKEVIDYHLFKPLTNSIHKSILEKLAIPLDETDVSFLEVKIDSIKPNSVPAEIMEISTQKDSFFRSLSCFFTGKEKNWEDVKWGIRKYFFDNYKTFDNFEGIDFSKMVMFDDNFLALQTCNYLIPFHFNYICLWLEIRIGIFRNAKFEKYGNWENTESSILLFKSDNEIFTPVISLIS